VDDISLVVHVDPPAEHKAFLHRSGRTARAGASGTVVTVMTPDQRGDVDILTRRAGIKPTHTKVQPDHPIILELTGPVAERRMRKMPEVAPAAPAKKSTGRKPNSHQPRGGRPQAGRPSGPGSSDRRRRQPVAKRKTRT
jgi:superfamily II DNA/RNA helicase